MTTYMSDALGSTIGTFQAGAVLTTTFIHPTGRRFLKPAQAQIQDFCGMAKPKAEPPAALTRSNITEEGLQLTNAQWSSVDLKWPTYDPYGFVLGRPASKYDSSGLEVNWTLLGCKKSAVADTILYPTDPCNWYSEQKCSDKSSDCRKNLTACMAANGFPNEGRELNMSYPSTPAGPGRLREHASRAKKPGSSICPPLCAGRRNGGGPPDASTMLPWGPPPNCPKPPKPEQLVPPAFSVMGELCQEYVALSGCDCIIAACKNLSFPSNFFHELTHCSGFSGAPTHNDPSPANKRNDFVYTLGCCMCKLYTHSVDQEINCSYCDNWNFPS